MKVAEPLLLHSPLWDLVRSASSLSRIKNCSSSNVFAEREKTPVNSAWTVQTTIKEINRNKIVIERLAIWFLQVVHLVSTPCELSIGFLMLSAVELTLCLSITDFIRVRARIILGMDKLTPCHFYANIFNTIPPFTSHKLQEQLCSPGLSCWSWLMGLCGKCLSLLQARELSIEFISEIVWEIWISVFLSAFLLSLISACLSSSQTSWLFKEKQRIPVSTKRFLSQNYRIAE